MPPGPTLYLTLSLNDALEVKYSTVHLFNSESEIIRTRVSHGDHYPIPSDELGEMLEWSANHVDMYYQGAFNDYVG